MPANAGDTVDADSIPESRRSPTGGNSNPLQYSCQDNPMDREGWQATDPGVAKSQPRLSTHTHREVHNPTSHKEEKENSIIPFTFFCRLSHVRKSCLPVFLSVLPSCLSYSFFLSVFLLIWTTKLLLYLIIIQLFIILNCPQIVPD